MHAQPEYKPGTRQAPKKAVATGERSWWETVKPGEMTKAAVEQQERMSTSKEAKKTGIGGANFKW